MTLSASLTLSLTASLTEEEHEIFDNFMAEQGIDDPAEAFRAMLHELVRLHDALWDEQFANSEALLEEMGRQALESYNTLTTPAH